MKKLIDELLQAALQCDISVLDFWDMTCLEVIQTIEAYEKKKKLSLQEEASMVYQEAQTISCFIGGLMGKGKVPSLHESFPFLFEEDKKEIEKQEKDNLLSFVERHNKKGANTWKKE